MKNLITVVARQEIHDFVYGLWQSEVFRASQRDKGFVHDLVEQFAWLPRFFAEESNDALERAHFCTWWNVIMLRNDYTNPIINDLYILHEIAHAATMPYVPDMGRAAFDEKMQRNELEASVLSEIQVYFEMPELRGASFAHPIYADRFLNDFTMQALWKANRRICIETIRAKRKDVMVGKPEHTMDLTEQWIRRFAEQNVAYSISWSRRYNAVERQMAQFQQMSTYDRSAAARFHEAWLRAEAGRDTKDGIPFREEAELFTPFYWANKADYTKAMKGEPA